MTDVQKSPANLLKDALKYGGFREEVFECETASGERRLIPPFITSLIAGNLSLTIEFGEEIKSKSTAKRITYDVFVKNIYPEEYELTYEDSADYAECAATEIPKAVMLKTKRESIVHHERVYKRLCKDVEANVKDEEKKKAALERKKAVFDERIEAVNRNKFPTWDELDTIEDPEKVWYNRMMKATHAYHLDIDWDFEFDYADKEDKKVTCTVQVHQKKEGEEEATFLFKLDHSAELGSGKDEESGRYKTKGDFVRQIKGQLSEDIVNQLVTEGIMTDVDSSVAILAERHAEAVEARLNETEEEREARIAKAKEERKKAKKEGKDTGKKDNKKKSMRQKLKERKEAKKNAKETEKAKKKALEEKIAAKKEKLKAKAKAKRDAKKGKKEAEDDKPKKGAKNNAAKKGGNKNDAPAKKPTKTKDELRTFYLETIKKVSKNEKLDEEKKKKLCEKYKKIYHEKLDALKAAGKPARAPRNNNSRDERKPREQNSRNDRRGGRDDSRGAPKRGRDDRDQRQPRGGKQMNYGQPVVYQPVMMPQQMYAPPPAQAYQPQPVQQSYGYQNKGNQFSASSQIAQLQAQQQQQMAALQAQLQQFQQPAQRAPRHPQSAGRQPQRPAGRRGW